MEQPLATDTTGMYWCASAAGAFITHDARRHDLLQACTTTLPQDAALHDDDGEGSASCLKINLRSLYSAVDILWRKLRDGQSRVPAFVFTVRGISTLAYAGDTGAISFVIKLGV